MDTTCTLLGAIKDTFAVINYHAYEVQGSCESADRRGRAYHFHEHMHLHLIPAFPLNHCGSSELVEFLAQFDPAFDIADGHLYRNQLDVSELDYFFERCAVHSFDGRDTVGSVQQAEVTARSDIGPLAAARLAG